MAIYEAQHVIKNKTHLEIEADDLQQAAEVARRCAGDGTVLEQFGYELPDLEFALEGVDEVGVLDTAPQPGACPQCGSACTKAKSAGDFDTGHFFVKRVCLDCGCVYLETYRLESAAVLSPGQPEGR